MLRSIKFSSNILRNTSQQLRNYANNSASPEKSIVNVTILGRAGKDPEQHQKGDRTFVTFSVATNHNYKDSNGEMARCSVWHQVLVLNEGLGRNVYNNLVKGQRALVTGRMSYSQITDQDGKPKQKAQLIADDVVMMQYNSK